MQQDVRWARTCKRARRGLIYGIRHLLEIHYALLGPAYDTSAAANAYLVQMSPISYLDEFERLQLVEMRNNVAGAMVALGGSLNADPTVWSMYILSHYLKLPDEMVIRLMTRAGAVGAAPGQPDGDPEAAAGQAAQKAESGHYGLNGAERQRLDEALRRSPQLRGVVRRVAELSEEDVVDVVARQTDTSLSPILDGVRGQATLCDSVEESEDVRALLLESSGVSEPR